jgi:hypothetical protein
MNPSNSVLEAATAVADLLIAKLGSVGRNGDASLHPTTTEDKAVTITALTTPFNTVRLLSI